MTACTRRPGWIVTAAWLLASACSDPAPSDKKPEDSGQAQVQDASDAAAADDVTDAAAADTAIDSGPAEECQQHSDCDGKPAPAACRTWRCEDQQCVLKALSDGAVCEDGGPCKPGVCSLGTCNAKAKVCPNSGDDCMVAACDPANGQCKENPATDGTACDDGNPCTTGDTCKTGSCAAGKVTCQCSADKDCEGRGGGNPCDGTLFCNKQSGSCELNPGSVVSCNKDNDTACTENACQAATGKCAMQPRKDGTVCDDKDKCTKGDVCTAGKCGGKDICSCKEDADCAEQEDGNACNGTLFCNKALKVCELNPATIVKCASAENTACYHNLCAIKTGVCALTAVNDDKPCDDENSCTPDDTCKNGKCGSAKNTCECKVDADCDNHEDGNLCNGTLYCDQQKKTCTLNPATIIKCQTVDNTACSKRTCAPKTGKCAMVSLPDGATCTDGNPCTDGDACDKGVCKPSVTSPTCSCQADADCSKFEDGDLCNGTLVCNKAEKSCVIEPKTIVSCDSVDNTVCKAKQCVPKTGKCTLMPLPQHTQCDDGQKCTIGDRCDDKGSCVGANDVCVCGPHKPGYDCEKEKGDGKACNGTLWCDTANIPFTCKVDPKTPVSCDGGDDTVCKANTCDEKTGKCGFSPVQANAGKPCDDQHPCTAQTLCQDGECKGGKPTECDDKDPCTDDSCGKTTGCVHLANALTACDDNNACTVGTMCIKAKCSGGLPVDCNDGNACTDDSCAPSAGPGGAGKKGCVNAANTAACDDGDNCAKGEKCDKGACVGGKPLVCDDGNPCTSDFCDQKDGKCQVSANDGAPCSLKGGPGQCAQAVCGPIPPCSLFDVAVGKAAPEQSVTLDVRALTAGGYVAGGKGRSKDGKWAPRATRVDRFGKVLWSWQDTSFNGSADTEVAAVFDATDAGPIDDRISEVVLAGTASKNGAQGAVWRLTDKGGQKWLKLFGAPGDDHFYGGALRDDGLILVGAASSKSNGKTDCWVVRTEDANLAIKWEARIGGSGLDSCHAAHYATSSRLFVAGTTESAGLGGDVLVARMSSAGQVYWKKNFGGSGRQEVFGLHMTPGHDVVLLGRNRTTVSQAYALIIDDQGKVLQERTSKAATAWLRADPLQGGQLAVFGLGDAVGIGTAETTTRALVLGVMGADGKVLGSEALKLTVPANPPTTRPRLVGDRLLVPGATFDKANGSIRAGLAVATWQGATSCGEAGECEDPALPWCDDGEACTTDTCDPKTGCKHAVITGCKLQAEVVDIDHDGVLGSADPCPTTWSPEGGTGACPNVPAALGKRSDVTLTGDGPVSGLSRMRRTHEPVELPLRNGWIDQSLLAWWKLDGNFNDASGNGYHLKNAVAQPTTGVFGGEKTAMLTGVAEQKSSSIGPIVVRDMTFMAWISPRSSTPKNDCKLLDIGSKTVPPATAWGHVSIRVSPPGRLYTSMGTHDGSWSGPGIAKNESDKILRHDRSWQHVAFTLRAGKAVQLFVDGQPVRPNEQGIPGGPIALAHVGLGDEDDCVVAMDDALLFKRALHPTEIAAYVQSRRPFGSTSVPGAQVDFDDVRVEERAAWQQQPHLVRHELLGARPWSTSELQDVLAYWRLDGDGKDQVSAQTTAKLVGTTWGEDRFGALNNGPTFNGTTSYIEVQRPLAQVGDFTAQLWFYLGAKPNQRSFLLDTRGADSGADGVVMVLDQTTTAGVYKLGHGVAVGGKVHGFTGDVAVQTGWHHTALRRKNGVFSAFLDGEPVPGSWSNGASSTAKLNLFGSKIARLGYSASGKTGVPFTNDGLQGGIDEVVIHKVGLSDHAIANRAIGPPRARFLASTSPQPGKLGFPFHFYALRWGSATSKPWPLAVVGVDKKTACDSLLSPCTGYAGVWTMDGTGVVLDSSSNGRHGVVKQGAVIGGGRLQTDGKGGHVDLGAWLQPLVGGDYTLAWHGWITQLSTVGSNAPLVGRQGNAPALRVQGAFAHHSVHVAGGAKGEIKGAEIEDLPERRWSIAGAGSAKTKQSWLHVDGVSAPPLSGFVTLGDKPAPLLVGSDGSGTLAATTDTVILRNRAVTADETWHWPPARASIGVAAGK